MSTPATVTRKRAIHQLLTSLKFSHIRPITMTEIGRGITMAIRNGEISLLNDKASVVAKAASKEVELYRTQVKAAVRADKCRVRNAERKSRNCIATTSFHPDNTERKRYEVITRRKQTIFIDKLSELQWEYEWDITHVKDYIRNPSHRKKYPFIIEDNYPERITHRYTS